MYSILMRLLGEKVRRDLRWIAGGRRKVKIAYFYCRMGEMCGCSEAEGKEPAAREGHEGHWRWGGWHLTGVRTGGKGQDPRH